MEHLRPIKQIMNISCYTTYLTLENIYSIVQFILFVLVLVLVIVTYTNTLDHFRFIKYSEHATPILTINKNCLTLHKNGSSTTLLSPKCALLIMSAFIRFGSCMHVTKHSTKITSVHFRMGAERQRQNKRKNIHRVCWKKLKSWTMLMVASTVCDIPV